MILNFYKPLGWTPLQVIEAYKKHHPELENEKMTYAGRLDPMAEGVLVVLTGSDVYQKDEYLGREKKYQAKILLGFETDTQDALGLVTSVGGLLPDADVKGEMERIKGWNTLLVPGYSSIVVQGKPLVLWAREGKLSRIDIPRKEMIIHEVEVSNESTASSKQIKEMIFNGIDNVNGDFRQEVIKQRWREVLPDSSLEMRVIDVNLRVSSGTYIRSIASELGKRLGCGAILLHLKRSNVGEFAEQSAFNIVE